jgi:hypothetical protein
MEMSTAIPNETAKNMQTIGANYGLLGAKVVDITMAKAFHMRGIRISNTILTAKCFLALYIEEIGLRRVELTSTQMGSTDNFCAINTI